MLRPTVLKFDTLVYYQSQGCWIGKTWS